MKITHITMSLFFCAISAFGFSQEITSSGATYEGTVSSVEYVTSMASRPNDLLPPNEKIREAQDSRSMSSLIATNKNLQDEDDYFVQNRHESEATRVAGPPSLVFRNL